MVRLIWDISQSGCPIFLVSFVFSIRVSLTPPAWRHTKHNRVDWGSGAGVGGWVGRRLRGWGADWAGWERASLEGDFVSVAQRSYTKWPTAILDLQCAFPVFVVG